MNEDNGYEKLILFPPPLNFFVIPLLIVSPSEKLSTKISDYLGHLFFWLENIFLIILHFFYFVALDLFIYVKILLQLCYIEGVYKKLGTCVLWVIFGFIFLLKLNLEDTCVFFNILCFEKSVSFNHEADEKKKLI